MHERSRSSGRVGSRLWYGDVRRVLMTNLLEHDGPVWLITVTAPGADLLPWDTENTEKKRVVPQAAHDWNASAQARWSELHRWAHQATGRDLGRPPRMLARVWQMQSRGVLHLHLVVGFAPGPDQAAAKLYVSKLRARAREFKFGFVDAVDRDGKSGRSRVMEPQRAAGYLSRYLGDSSQLAEAVALRDRPSRLIWVSPTLTAATLCTMTRLRRVRLLWRIRSGTSSIFRHAGELPVWFRDRVELAAVHSLLRDELQPAAP